MSTENEFKRLLKKTTDGPSGAPWWARWLLQTAIFLGVIALGATLIDWVWLYGLGRPPFAVCGAIGLLPISLLASAGLLAGIGGVIGILLGARAIGLAWLIIGVLLSQTPDIVAASGLGGACPWLGVD